MGKTLKARGRKAVTHEFTPPRHFYQTLVSDPFVSWVSGLRGASEHSARGGGCDLRAVALPQGHTTPDPILAGTYATCFCTKLKSRTVFELAMD